jgi:cobalamin biosynthesis Mg chelatase CobN
MAPLSKKSQDVLLENNQCNEDGGKDEASSSNEVSHKDYRVGSSNASGSNSKSGSSHTGTTEEEVNMINEELARHETTNVLRLRILVILLLVAVAVAVSYTIYDITHKSEIEAFETEFVGVAESIITSLNGKYTDMGVGK